MSDFEDYMEDEYGNPVNSKGETWIECDRCGAEGCYEYNNGDASDWGEDCPSEINHIITCRDCRGEGGFWVKFEEK